MFKKLREPNGFGKPTPKQVAPEAAKEKAPDDPLEVIKASSRNGRQSVNNTATSGDIYNTSSNQAELLFRLGLSCCLNGDYNDGISKLESAREIDPFVYSTHFNLGKAYMRVGRINEAIRSLKKSLELNEGNPDALLELASCHAEQGNLKLAKKKVREILQKDPMHAGALNNLGLMLANEGKYSEAFERFTDSSKIDPDYKDALINAAMCLQNLGNFSEEEKLLRLVVAEDSQNHDANKNLALCLLRQEKWEEGWRRYEVRLEDNQDSPVVPYVIPEIPRWTGTKLEPNSRYCVVAEQGLGDFIQFARYFTALKKQVSEVNICCPDDVHEILRSSNIAKRPISAKTVEWNSFDYWIPLLSLPLILRLGEDPYLSNKRYMKIPKLNLRMAHNADSNVPCKKLTIAINWQGSSTHEKGKLSVGRSFPLEALAPLAELDDVELLSLQFGPGTEQLDCCSFRNKFLKESFHKRSGGLEESASLIEMSDLVITNDSAPAHLAGALGKKTFILLKKCADWRWGTDETRTKWYRSIHLYRQTREGVWDDVITKAINDVVKIMKC